MPINEAQPATLDSLRFVFFRRGRCITTLRSRMFGRRTKCGTGKCRTV